MRITLLRHGKPSFALKGCIQGRHLRGVARLYDLSGVEGAPPDEAVAAVAGGRFVVCSHLKRSIESAKALGYHDIDISDPLFCESAIPHFRGGSIPMPIGIWVVFLRLIWMFGFSRNGESLIKARSRAREAALRLVQFAEAHQNVVLIGHGFINHFIAKELRRIGWLRTSRPGKGYWGYHRFERSAVSGIETTNSAL